MRPQDIIAKKRDGEALSEAQIRNFVDGVCDGSWADYQISAMIMAIFIRGLDSSEQEMLTRNMLFSGEVLDLSSIDRPVADKHSTGGVGDKTSLIIAPTAAACGLAVPMISGRGLGHTGGTLDKLESISGFNVNLTTEEFQGVLKACGYVMAGQTAEIAPADKKLYALRDATATVPYIPLIVASIMSKKLAEDLDALVLDVKTGSGAFMRDLEDSRRLAAALVETGKAFGVNTQAVVSDMNQPLGKYVGHSHEVFECIKIMRDEADTVMISTRDLAVELTSRMILLGGLAATDAEAVTKVNNAIESGRALDTFRRNIELQGGDPSVCDYPESLLSEDLREITINAGQDGFVSGVDAMAVGEAICDIGGGRIKADDGIDHAVGFSCEVKIGAKVTMNQPLGTLYCRESDGAEASARRIRGAFTITHDQPENPPLIRNIVS
ncbi:MAG: thymidine phosphorylase [Pyrinomonadaceae bacterium]